MVAASGEPDSLTDGLLDLRLVQPAAGRRLRGRDAVLANHLRAVAGAALHGDLVPRTRRAAASGGQPGDQQATGNGGGPGGWLPPLLIPGLPRPGPAMQARGCPAGGRAPRLGPDPGGLP
jgi:hypothetical protein